MELIESLTFNKVDFRIKAQTILLVEEPSMSNARNIDSTLEDALSNKHGIELCHFMEDFTMVTDGLAVMARVVDASVIPDLHIPDETWLCCMVLLLNNGMKKVVIYSSQSDVLLVVVHDFHATKKIPKYMNRAEWNHLLPDGLR